MKKIVILFLISITNITFGLHKEVIARTQFPTENIGEYLKQKVPFLDQEFNQMDHTVLKEFDNYEISFTIDTDHLEIFAAITGKSFIKTRFIVSWYIFSSNSEVPSSPNDMMYVLNTKKPADFSILTFLNQQWVSTTEFTQLRKTDQIYVFISFANKNGVLLPLVGQSFYKDHISNLDQRAKMSKLNLEMLYYWVEKGYL
ncbi:MAG: hypothetical protein ACRCV0_06140 [Brevinema sp.]